jgi:RNA polymerase sigma-70 factor (ECF subfamily)
VQYQATTASSGAGDDAHPGALKKGSRAEGGGSVRLLDGDAQVEGAESRAQVAALYARYGPAIYRRCLRLLRDTESARDATQEVFRKLLREPRMLGTAEVALPFIYRVALNHCLNERRNLLRRGPHEELEDLEVASDVPHDSYPSRELAQQVLKRFDADTQAVAVAVLVDGMEHEEVAQVLGMSRKTVSRKLQRFLDNARKFLLRSEP